MGICEGESFRPAGKNGAGGEVAEARAIAAAVWLRVANLTANVTRAKDNRCDDTHPPANANVTGVIFPRTRKREELQRDAAGARRLMKLVSTLAMLLVWPARAFHMAPPTTSSTVVERMSGSRQTLHRRAPYILSKMEARSVVPQEIPLYIVYEDDDLLALDKPAGMTVQLAQNAVENAVVHYLNSTSCQWSTPSWPWKGDESFEGIVHRLDKGTSGLLVIGKHPIAARALQAAFRERRVHKTYLAIAVGWPTFQPSLSLDALAAANGKSSRSRKSKAASPGVASPQKQLARDIQSCGRDVEQALALLDSAFAAGNFQPDAACYSATLSVCVRGMSAPPASQVPAHATSSSMPRSQRLSSRRASVSGAEAIRARETALYILESMHTRGVPPEVSCFQMALTPPPLNPLWIPLWPL